MKKRELDSNEPILFLWADSLIRDTDGFVASALRAGEVAVEKKKIVFMGAEPTYASTGLGYMKKSTPLKEWDGVFALDTFVEKPDRKTAEAY